MAPPMADQARMQKSKRAVAGERDKLLKRADRKIDVGKYMHQDSKDRARVIVITICLFLFGNLPYAGIIWTWFSVFHESFAQAVVTFVLLFGIGFLLMAGSSKQALGKERPWMFWLGLVWLFASFFSLVLGFFLYYRSMAFFWKYEQMRTYTDVAAAQNSNAFADGSMFLFTEDTRLDSLRAVGYKSKWTGDTYCVAPIVDPTMNQAAPINYWAVGENCCASRAEFHCGDSQDFTTRSALRKLQPDEVVRPWMQWAVAGNTYAKYMQAVQLQTASYMTTAAAQPTLVTWSKDPVAAKDGYYENAKQTAITVSLIYGAFVLIGCYFIGRQKLLPNQRPEGVLRDA